MDMCGLMSGCSRCFTHLGDDERFWLSLQAPLDCASKCLWNTAKLIVKATISVCMVLSLKGGQWCSEFTFKNTCGKSITTRLIKSMCKAANKLRNRRSVCCGPPIFCSVQCDSGEYNL